MTVLNNGDHSIIVTVKANMFARPVQPLHGSGKDDGNKLFTEILVSHYDRGHWSRNHNASSVLKAPKPNEPNALE